MKIYLKEHNQRYLYLNLDNWLIPKESRTPEMTVKDRYKYNDITNDIQKLLNRETISIKKYDIKNRNTSNETLELKYNNDSILIIDWVVSLDIPYLNEISNLKIFCDIEEGKRKSRFYEFYKYKWLSDEEITELYNKRQNDEYKYIINCKETAAYALNINQ